MLPAYVWARLDLSSPFESELCVGLNSPSVGPDIVVGLTATVELAVAVGAVLPKLARLVTLAGLVSELSSKCTGLGMVIAFAATDIPLLIDVVAVGASPGLLIPTPSKDDKTF